MAIFSTSDSTSDMRLLCLACEAFARPFYRQAASSPHLVDIRLFKIGLHNKPANLREQLQAELDAEPAGYDAILLGYGLCGRATDSLTARSTRLVLPRAHDCITLFLGSRQRYNEQHDLCPGTYWYTPDYIERRESKHDTLALGAGSEANLADVYAEYVLKYGKDNADYLMEVMGAWQQHYQRAAFIDPGDETGQVAQAAAQAQADRRGWLYELLPGDEGLIRKLLHGEWDNDFLLVNPGQQVRMSGDAGVVKTDGVG